MTAFFTRYFKKTNLTVIFLFSLFLMPVAAASDSRLSITQAELVPSGEQYLINADLELNLSEQVVDALSKGVPPGPETSVMKLFAAEYLRRLGNAALEMLGPEGMLIDDTLPTGVDWQQRFLFAPAIRIAGGSNEVQRNIMAERVLGLPGELRTDRDVPFREIGKHAS